jgi:hypothetical protein
MRPDQFERWKSEALAEVFAAIAAADALRSRLIFKGARVLNLRLNLERQSFDLDSSLTTEFALETVDLKAQGDFLQAAFIAALERYFSGQRVVRYKLESVTLKSREHPLGWDSHAATVRIRDRLFAGVLNLPGIEIDISAPEPLSLHAVSDLPIGEHSVRAYTLERIAGEKLRAFLSTLPDYRKKVKKPGEAIRVKDLYDLARICRVRPLADRDFWRKAAEDFRLACAARYIDCAGPETFRQNGLATEQAFGSDPTLPKDVTFGEVNDMITRIGAFLIEERVAPLHFPLPPAKSGS